MTITADSIKSTIKSRLLEMLESRREFISHSSFLETLGIKIKNDRLYLSECIESVAKKYIEDLCKNLTDQYSNGTPAEISVDSDLYMVITRRDRELEYSEAVGYGKSPGTDTDTEKEFAFIERYLNAVDFDQIASGINRQAKELGATGLEIFADKIIYQLHLANMDGYYAPYRKGRWVICQAYPLNYNDNYRKLSELSLLSNALREIEKESGVQFGSALEEYMDAGNNLRYGRETIASRTVFGKGGNLEICCFKEKHEYRFTHKAFEALMAFLTINGKADHVDKIMSKTDLLEAA
jgi:hypothetical protein